MYESLTFSLQALLVRHETYMADAERTRQEMGLRIEQLETDKKDLEAENARTVEENRALLDQLEGMNSTIADSETHVKSLEATLETTQQELHRLEVLAARAQTLEIQLAIAEQQHAVLQQTIRKGEEDERSAIQRWKKAERELFDVQEQLERMEREGREERERHSEVISRMERQRAVEKELDTAAGRLKGAAAAASLGKSKTGSSVVSNFVKDILQDNANLQLGIVELRELLANSNDEVQTLREQLLRHQPVEKEDGATSSDPSTLKSELISKEPQVVSQELHIHHHHYHKSNKDEFRRPKKKRNTINAVVFTPRRSRPGSTSAATILSQTSSTVPSPVTSQQRWSLQSATTVSESSSLPSSPISAFRSPALFDRGNIDQAFDSSRPTSPGSSVDPTSPAFQPHHRKHGSEFSSRGNNAAIVFPLGHTIHEEEDDDDDDVDDLPSLQSAVHGDCINQEENKTGVADDYVEEIERPRSPDDFFSPMVFRPTLRRSTSHESILSVSGLDINTFKSRPSQIAVPSSRALLRPLARQGSSSFATSYVTTQPIISSSSAMARPTLSHRVQDSSAYLRTSMGISERSSQASNGSMEGLGKRVGGWMWSRWGVTPTPSSTSSIHITRDSQSPQRSGSTHAPDSLRAFMGRPPGINQKGLIPGIWKADPAPSKVTADSVDEEALREVLLE